MIRVDKEMLQGSDLAFTVSVAKRMSWAAARQTTTLEDMSYCLFGIFGVHLPLIYGEGWKAFIRLQEAIALESNDLSVYSWHQEDQALRGIFAHSPAEFKRWGSIKRVDNIFIPTPEFAMTNKGFQIRTQLVEEDGGLLFNLQRVDSGILAPEGGDDSIAIRPLKTAHGYTRHGSAYLTVCLMPAGTLTTSSLRVLSVSSKLSAPPNPEYSGAGCPIGSLSRSKMHLGVETQKFGGI